MTASYYQAGTVAVTNGSDTVTGTGTAFVANLTPGETFRLVSGGDQYEITAVTSDTQFKIDPAYMGATQSGLDYRIVPIRGYGATVVAAMTTAIGLWTGFRDGPLAGLFSDGAAGDSAIGFKSAPGTGWWRKTNGDMAGQRNGTELLTLESGQVRIKKLVGDAVQSSVTDAVSGMLLKFGAFGLGSTAPKATGSDLDAIVGSGFWYADSTVANKPASGNYLVLHMGQTTDVATQIAISRSSADPNATFVRAKISGVWQPWKRLDAERGSNANGEYVRFGDGTQICWHFTSAGAITYAGAGTWDNPYRSQPFQWAFPASFADNPIILSQGEPPVGAPDWFRRNSSSSSGGINALIAYNIELTRFGPNATADVFDVSLLAIGRWF